MMSERRIPRLPSTELGYAAVMKHDARINMERSEAAGLTDDAAKWRKTMEEYDAEVQRLRASPEG
jgi:hypothetical protein